ncbi:MAG: ribosome maturation factor RimM [Vicinamibacterales bacterium]
MVVVGRVARAHGNRGEVIVNPETDFPETRFHTGSELNVRHGDTVETLRVAGVRSHQGRPIIAFDGVTTMDAAEALAGAELRVDTAAIVPLSAGEFYRHELVGCRVETTDGHELGNVRRVEAGPGADRLVVAGARGEILVPLARDICVTIDPVARRIIIAPPDGLLELNE